MSDLDLHRLSEQDRGRLARGVMRRQGGLSLRVAAVFVLLVLGVPLVNAYLPEQANVPIFGFPATWLFLGVLIYPVTVALAFYFVASSNKIEAHCSNWQTILKEEESR